MREAIHVQGLSKSFNGRKVVDNLDLSVNTGEIYGFLGPNGSGKTTSIRMLCGLLTADAGEGQCLGFDFRTQSAEIKRQVGYMTQRFSFYEDLSIRENLEFVARVYGMKNRQQAVDEAIEQLGLGGRDKQLAGSLSGGWKQRMSLAACLLHKPKLLLLDEPTAGVDPKARRDFWEEIHDLAAAGITVLVSTHYMDEAERCNRLAYIAYGKLLAQGTPDELVANSGLYTWILSGANVSGIMGELRGREAVAQVVPFGTTLHVSGTDAEKLAALVHATAARHGLQAEASAPRLEDIFIQLMGSSADNFQGRPTA